MAAGPAPHVLLLGGSTGALAVARELRAHGVVVHLSTRASRPELRTRAAETVHPYRSGADAPALWRELTLGDEPLGAPLVVLPCDDDGVEFVARHHEALRARHVVDLARPEHLQGFLDKARTAALVAGTGVHVPRTWEVSPALDLQRVMAEARGAVLVKPVHSHLFQRAFGTGGRKYLRAESADELARHLGALRDKGLEALVMELVPGPDRNSTTYYGYRARDGRYLFEFTKRVLRRHPRNEGPGSLHVVEWDEATVREARKLLAAVEFHGYANIEFKRDARDGRLVLVELNPRFTASQELLVRAGIPAATIVYEHLCGRATAAPRQRDGLLLWDPVRDWRAYREHRGVEGLSLGAWLRSLRGERVHFLFRAADPMPALARMAQLLGRGFGVGRT